MPSEERAIPLSWKLLFVLDQLKLARNPFQVRNSVRPMHLFDHTFDHGYYFELPSEGERDTQSITRCSTSHHRLIRAFPRANRTLSTAHNPIPCVASSKGEPPVCAPWRPWRFCVLAASSGGNTYSAIPGGCAPSLVPLPPAGNATASFDGENQAKGVRLPLSDLLIGVTALELGYSVATGNLRHFQMIPGLSVVQF